MSGARRARPDTRIISTERSGSKEGTRTDSPTTRGAARQKAIEGRSRTALDRGSSETEEEVWRKEEERRKKKEEKKKEDREKRIKGGVGDPSRALGFIRGRRRGVASAGPESGHV